MTICNSFFNVCNHRSFSILEILYQKVFKYKELKTGYQHLAMLLCAMIMLPWLIQILIEYVVCICYSECKMLNKMPLLLKGI